MAHETLLGACRHLNDCVCWRNLVPNITSLIRSLLPSTAVAASCCGDAFPRHGQETVRTEGKVYINPYWRSFFEEVGMSDCCKGLYSTRQWPQVKHIWSGLRPASFPERLKNVCALTPVLNPFKHEQLKVNDTNLKQKSASLYDHSQEKQS